MNNKQGNKKEKLWSRMKKGFQKISAYKVSLGKKGLGAKVSQKDKSKDLPFTEKVRVEETKFYMGPAATREPRRVMTELPAGYGRDKIVLQTRDPWWLHAYWEVNGSTMERLRQQLRDEWFSARLTLRVYDVTNIVFDGKNAHRYFDIELTADANNWYIDVGGPGRSWIVDLGLKLPDRFITIVRSNIAFTPLDGPSWITDEEWMVPDDIFARLYGLSIGFGSSPVRKPINIKELLKRQFASGGLFSLASPVKKELKEKGFWLVVNTELILYGATEPDAKVTVQGRPLKLRSDGTFSLRFALPDGKQVIPVKAQSGDGEEEKIIIPIVTKETK
mgnify:CR=1 FL=1